jgi:hypothetical protein
MKDVHNVPVNPSFAPPANRRNSAPTAVSASVITVSQPMSAFVPFDMVLSNQ